MPVPLETESENPSADSIGLSGIENGVPDTNRTYDLQLRRLTLYPTELRAPEVLSSTELKRPPHLLVLTRRYTKRSGGPLALVLYPVQAVLPAFGIGAVVVSLDLCQEFLHVGRGVEEDSVFPIFRQSGL
jgi:hypothetical protein